MKKLDLIPILGIPAIVAMVYAGTGSISEFWMVLATLAGLLITAQAVAVIASDKAFRPWEDKFR